MSDVQDIIRQLKGLSRKDQQQVAAACGVKSEHDPGAATLPSSSSWGYNNPARISNFSGDDAKGEVTFEQWRFEERDLIRDKIHPEPGILQTLRRSLRGRAADVFLHMGEDAIKKMGRIFGNILSPEAVLEQLYSAKQSASETVASWACRIEDLLSNLQDKKGERASKPLVDSASAKTMVRTKFFLDCGLVMSRIPYVIHLMLMLLMKIF